MTDLPKAFYRVNHELYIAKLHAHGLDFTLFELISSYLNKRKQKCEPTILSAQYLN